MIDLLTEDVIDTQESADFMAELTRSKTHPRTIIQLIRCGSNGVRLEGLKLGKKWVTSRQAIQRFAEALTAKTMNRPIPSSDSQARSKAHERADRELSAAGL
jgi:hypothetical protein